jgi:hypothetical protein
MGIETVRLGLCKMLMKRLKRLRKSLSSGMMRLSSMNVPTLDII